MIIVSGTIHFADRQARDGAVAASIELQLATRLHEPGCLAYVFTADPVEPHDVHVYEAWTDQAALAAHFEHPNYSAMRAILRQFPRAGASVVAKHDVVYSEPVYDTSGVARADWFERG